MIDYFRNFRGVQTPHFPFKWEDESVSQSSLLLIRSGSRLGVLELHMEPVERLQDNRKTHCLTHIGLSRMRVT